MDGIYRTVNLDEAVLDYNGANNTQTIISLLGTDKAPAAEACVAYTFPNGKKGYLGAAGEWQLVFNNKEAVESAMEIIGGIAIGNSWTSTGFGGSSVWCMFWSGKSEVKNKEEVSNVYS